MARLSISALGTLQISIDGNPATGFDSDKVRALLIFLAIEAEIPHRREKLAGLLWPEYTERSARANLRRALANLRKAIGDLKTDSPHLVVTPQTIQFDLSSDIELDVLQFQSLVNNDVNIEPLEVDCLYRGDFLEGFSIPDSAEFESWVLVTREALRGQMLRVLHRLANHYEDQGRYEKAIPQVRHLLDLDPYREDAYQQMMRLLALNGQRIEALAYFDSLRDLLKADLDISPSQETQSLYEHIRSSQIEPRQEPSLRRTIRGYELCERIGIGKYGAVYRAIQSIVARDVAIKVIFPHYIDQPDFIRYFEIEAQIIAHLEHPHIVPLYDFWREPGGAYLVMRWMRGGSLKFSLSHGSWKVESALRITQQIAAALGVAHRQGIIHRNIKPNNILLDEEGNAFLSDFGIAILTDPLLTRMEHDNFEIEVAATGSLGYQPPEVIKGAEITPEADIYSFGVILYELLVGEHPFPGLSGRELVEKHLSEPLPSIRLQRPELPVVVDQVIQQATAKNPSQRFHDPLSLATAFQNALAHRSQTAIHKIISTPNIQNPYKGLRPFHEADAAHFFGRETLIVRLIERLSEDGFGSRFLTVVGPSGSGKSSVVKAGVIPALRQGALPGSDHWFIIEMNPGSHPFEELETALLRIAINPPESMLDMLQESPRGLLRAVERSLPKKEQIELLFVIDQLEELFTLCEDSVLIRRFLESIYTAVTDPNSRLRVITTLRADFYNHPLQYPSFAELVRNRTEAVTPLTTGELENAIRQPARLAGVSIEEGLSTSILSEFNEQPGALPLLQYLMTELFEHRDADQLTQAVYEEIGGMHGALSSRAESLYDDLTPPEKEAAHQLFLRLVILREDLEDTRYRVPRSELQSIGIPIIYKEQSPIGSENSLTESHRADDFHEYMNNVIELFGKYRLLTFDRDPQTREPTIQIAHHALITEWRRLREWLDESRADKHIQRVLNNETTEWLEANRDSSFLLRGTQLDRYASWIKDTNLALSQVEREYIHASLLDRRAQEAAEATRLSHEQALENKSRRFLRTLVVVLAASTIMATILSLILFQQRNLAQSGIRISTSRELAQVSLTSMKLDPQLGLLLALQAIENTKAVDGFVTPEAENALHQAVQIAQPRMHHWVNGPGGNTIVRIAYHPSGSILAASSYRGSERPTTDIIDISTGEIIRTLPGFLISDAWEEEDNLATIYYLDGFTARYSLWNTDTGEEIAGRSLTLSGEAIGYEGYNYADLSPDGTLLVLAWEDVNEDIGISVWDLETGEEIFNHLSSGFERKYYAGFSRDGKQLITADEKGRIIIYDLKQDTEILSIQAHDGMVWRVRSSPDGMLLASAGNDQSVKLWDSLTGLKLSTLSGHDNAVINVVFNANGTLLASTCADGTVKLWDVKASLVKGSGVELFTLSGHYYNVIAAAFSPDENYMTTGGGDGQIIEWDISPPREGLTFVFDPLKIDKNPVYIQLSPQGDRLIVMCYGKESSVWDTKTGELLFRLASTQPETFSRATYTSDGKSIIGVFENGTIAVWDAQDGNKLLEFNGFSDEFVTVDTSPDGNIVAVGNSQGMIRALSLPALLQAATNQQPNQLEIYDIHASTWVSDIEFSPDGTIFGTTGIYGEGGGRPAKFWQSNTGQMTGPELHGWGWTFISMAYSYDSKLLATTSIDTPAMIWDALSGEQLFSLSGHDDLTTAVAYSPDGTRLATTSMDGTTKIWDTFSGKELITLRGHTDGVTDVVFSTDSKILYTASMDGTIRAYLMDIDELIALARERVTRQLTDEECLRYLHLEPCPADLINTSE